MSEESKGTRRFHLSDDARTYFQKIGVQRKTGNSKSTLFLRNKTTYNVCPGSLFHLSPFFALISY